MIDGKLKISEELKSRKAEEAKKEKSPNLQNVEEYIKIINDIYHFNSTSPNTGGPSNTENKVELQKTKTKQSSSNKGNQIDVNENKFSIRQLLDKSESQETYKKSFFVLSDELKEDDEEMSIKLKREILLNKLVFDKSIINGKIFSDSFNDNAISQIYLSLSSESRKILLENNYDNESLNFFHHLIGFNYEDFNKNQIITNDIILNLCNNILGIDDLFHLTCDKTSTEKDKKDNSKKEILMTEIEEIDNKVIFEEKKIEQVKENFREIINESNILIKGKEDDENLNDSGLNVLFDFIKTSKDKSVSEKVEKLLKIIGKNRDSKIKLDESIKNELLKNLKQEFLKEKDKLDKNRGKSNEKDSISKNESPPKSVHSKMSPHKTVPNKNIISNIPTQYNKDNNALLSESDGNITNPFINSLDIPTNRPINLQNKVNAKKEANDFNSANKVIYTTSGWGVNMTNNKKKINNNDKLNNQSKSIILNSQTSLNNSKVLKKDVVKSSNVTVKKLKDPINKYEKKTAQDKIKSKLTKQIEENKKRENNAWIGENEENDDDSDEWMVIK